MSEIWSIVSLSLLCGLAAFIDSIAGGGGLISLPAYLLIGLPAQLAAGSNKFSACSGTTIAIVRFAKSGKIQWREAIIGTLAALAGSSCATMFAIWLPEKTLKLAFLIVLPLVAVFMLVRGISKESETDTQPQELSLQRKTVVSILIGLIIGAYDGLIGPGSGTFMIIAATTFLHVSLVTASANTKVINFASAVSSLIVFWVNGLVEFKYAIPGAIFSLIGNYLGVGYCLRFGSRGIRKILVVVLVLLFAKLGYDAISGWLHSAPGR